ncbi:MAG TPA: hypothetical protein VL625_07630 [Patescibacteria group bacterium]|nr:hypothetical protein [Patescibacteria group bacterium]
MMGSTIKLLGLASFNAFVALALSASYLTHYAGKMQTLSNENVTAFVREFAGVTTGQRGDMDEHEMIGYFVTHVSEGASFSTTVNSSMEGVSKPANKMRRKEFIASTLRTIRDKGPHPASVTVEDVKISGDGHEATAITTINEKSALEFKNPADGEPGVSAVSATSYCNETVKLSNEHVIQIQSETCTTTIAPIDSF